MCKLDEKRFHDDTAAREYLEATIWPKGRVCPHCGSVDNSYVTAKTGVYRCAAAECRSDFSVTVGTVFERSKIALHKGLLASYLICSSKKGMSAHQLHRTIGVTYKTAWFMAHRLREAMKHDNGMFSSGGGTIEADATYVGGREKNKHASKRTKGNLGGKGKTMVFSLIDRETGKVRSTTRLATVAAQNLRPYLTEQLNLAKTRLITDAERPLRGLKTLVAEHVTVNHEAGEYVRGDITTNTVEGYFSILKRGIIGTFHHVSPHHLQRYATEFDFRYNHMEKKIKIDGKLVKVGFTDAERTTAMLKGISGKRLMYGSPRQTEA